MPLNRWKVLIVDDDLTQLTVVSGWIESLGYDVHIHSAAVGTTHMVNVYKPHLLLLDIHMPLLSGPALLEMIKKNGKPPWPSVIFYSGQNLGKLKDLPVTPPVIGFIQKSPNDAYFITQFRALAARARRSWV